MNAKQRRTLEQLLKEPAPRNIRWSDVISLMEALGAETIEGSGSRVHFRFGEEVVVMHRPHPRKELKVYAVRKLRDQLRRIGKLRC